MSELKGRRPRRQFDKKFRAQAVRLVLDDGKTVGAVARDLDLTPSALGAWVARAVAPSQMMVARGRPDPSASCRGMLQHSVGTPGR